MGRVQVRIRGQVKPLLLSLLLPILAMALLAVFTIGAVMLSANDRAIVWAEGTPGQLQEMQHRVLANPWFSHGRGRQATGTNPLPPECGASAREFSFGSLGEFEAQAAREILELMASETGARTCLSNVFIINELPERARQSWTQWMASTILGASILPLAMVLFVFAALSARMKLGTPMGNAGTGRTLAWGAGAGAGVSLLMAIAHWLGVPATDHVQAAASLSVANVGYPLAFTLVLAVPVIEEMAFRGWMIPLAERGMGSVPAALASSVLYAAASLPADAWSASGYFLVGAVYAGIYLRTRSVLACVVANVMVSVTSFWLA